MIKTRAIAFFITLGAVALGLFTMYGGTPFKLGLDLAGGTHLVYQADVSRLAPADIGPSMTTLRDVIERRVNIFGVSEPLVQIQNSGVFGASQTNQKLIVELPGVTDVHEAIKNIGETPVLDFRIITAAQQTAIGASSTLTTDADKSAALIAAATPTSITGRVLKNAVLEFDQTTGQPVVSLVFTSEGSDLFASTTKANVGNIIAIFLDGKPISLPVVHEQILGGKAQISGSFDVKTAQTLVRSLNYGALPVPITLISNQTIGASLGYSALLGGMMAGIIAFIIIGIFLIVWYRLPGLVAVLSLAIYSVIMLALFKLIPVTLTAAGIAGFVLTIGMAVDANILIFERMKEELIKGLPMWNAMHEGFARAWPSIRDSNLSSIITGVILYYFGSSSVITGFALVFIVGVIVSMLTAVSASRMFLYAIAPKRAGRIVGFLFSNGFHLGSTSGDITNNKK